MAGMRLRNRGKERARNGAHVVETTLSRPHQSVELWKFGHGEEPGHCVRQSEAI